MASDVPAWLRFWPLHLAGWATFFVGSVLSTLGWWDLDSAVPDRAVMTLVGFGLATGLRMLYAHLPADPPARLLVVAVVASAGAGVLWAFGHTMGTLLLLGTDDPWWFLRHAPRKVLGGAPLTIAVLLAWSGLYVALTAWRRTAAARARALRAEAAATQARLDALRYQLDPHFLFNTLNALSTLIAEGRAAEADRTIARLADFLRRTLDRDGHADVPLRDELAATRAYLAIEAVRFGARLRVEEAIAPEAEAVPVPDLLLQPLVENAVRHGIGRCEGGGTLALRAWRTNGTLHLAVTNSVPAGAHFAGDGIGLANVRARLAARYGGRATLACALEGGQAVVRLTLPATPDA